MNKLNSNGNGSYDGDHDVDRNGGFDSVFINDLATTFEDELILKLE